jgi:Response regulator containing CheY-like receiver domain and AraC-type DNA-binding domain
LLELNNHEVAAAYDGPEGIAKAREFRPELVLCDIGLPKMNGYDIARAFRQDEALNKIFLVALTGYAMPEDLQQAANAGFDRHLAKPVDLAELERMLAQLPNRFSNS